MLTLFGSFFVINMFQAASQSFEIYCSIIKNVSAQSFNHSLIYIYICGVHNILFSMERTWKRTFEEHRQYIGIDIQPTAE